MIGQARANGELVRATEHYGLKVVRAIQAAAEYPSAEIIAVDMGVLPPSLWVQLRIMPVLTVRQR